MLRSGEQVGAELIIMNGSGLTKFVMAGDVVVHPPAFVTTTSIICPFVRVLVEYVVELLFCMLAPPTLKL